MKKLLLLGAVPFLVGCSDGGYGFGYNGGAPAINWSNPGTADSYTCEEAGDNAEAYYATGEHPNLSDC
jgi:hypothetical protein|tara:strand:+ start:633 stop:836 length:204 start_codon:yes stop_codon:yes gene_type:complete